MCISCKKYTKEHGPGSPTPGPLPPQTLPLRPCWGIGTKGSRTEFRCRWVGVCPDGGRQIAAPTRGDVGFCLVGAVTNGPPVRFFAALRMTAQPCHPEERSDEGSFKIPHSVRDDTVLGICTQLRTGRVGKAMRGFSCVFLVRNTRKNSEPIHNIGSLPSSCHSTAVLLRRYNKGFPDRVPLPLGKNHSSERANHAVLSSRGAK